jgi:uncharacterized protein with ATP-grasp and redox domains
MAKVGIFGTITNLFTRGVPKVGDVTIEALTAAHVIASAGTNLCLVGHKQTEILLVESEQEFEESLADANMTRDEFYSRADAARNRFK